MVKPQLATAPSVRFASSEVFDGYLVRAGDTYASRLLNYFRMLVMALRNAVIIYYKKVAIETRIRAKGSRS